MSAQGTNEAGLAYSQVGLPHAEFLDQGNLDKVCTRPELRSQSCPKTSIYGHAKAWTPLLDEPVQGKVYLRSSKSMTASLSGGGTTIQFTGKVTGNKVQFQSGKCSKNDAKCKKVLGSLRSLSISPKAKFLRGNSASASSAGRKKSMVGFSGSTKRGGHPALRAVLTTHEGAEGGEANISKVQVALPHSAFLDQAHIKTICTRVQFAAGAGNGTECPAGSIYGQATVITPLLDGPLTGNVYLRSSEHPLPDLVIALKGPPSTPIDITLDGRVDSKNGGIRTTFENTPDAPATKVILEMAGGAKGLIVNSTNLCASVNKATVKMNGQNGKLFEARPVLHPAGCPKHHKKKH